MSNNPNPGRDGRIDLGAVGGRHSRRIVVGLVATATVLAACGGDDDVRSDTIEQIADGAGLSVEQATCIVDGILDDRTTDDLVAIGRGDELPADLQAELTELTGLCIVGAPIGDQFGEEEDEGAGSAEPTTTLEPVISSTSDDDAAVDDTDGGPTGVGDPDPSTCLAGSDLLVAWNGADRLPDDDPALLRVVFAEIDARVTQLDLVDGPLDSSVETMSSSFGRIQGGMNSAGFDFDQFLAVEANALAGDAERVEVTVEEIERYVADVCGTDLAELDPQATVWADALLESTGSSLDDVGLGQGPIDTPPAPFVEVVDDLGRITVDVPIAWTDVDGAATEGAASLIAARDVETYRASWLTDGVQIVLQDAGGAAAGSALVSSTIAAAECELVDTEPYDDGVYVGELATYRSCGGASTEAVVIGANDAAGMFEVVVTMQFVDGVDEAIVDTVIRSFLVR